MTTFWATHQVGGPYHTLTASQNALIQRAHQYPTLYDLMPVRLPGKTILDYGCGPGHDTILFLQSGAEHVYYSDASPMARNITAERLELHGLSDRATELAHWLPQQNVADHVHCAGVLHHTADPLGILKDLRRAMSPGGETRVMIYDGLRSTHTQSEVPITRWWTDLEFAELATAAGFRDVRFVGGYDCSAEWRPDCQAACYRLT